MNTSTQVPNYTPEKETPHPIKITATMIWWFFRYFLVRPMYLFAGMGYGLTEYFVSDADPESC